VWGVGCPGSAVSAVEGSVGPVGSEGSILIVGSARPSGEVRRGGRAWRRGSFGGAGGLLGPGERQRSLGSIYLSRIITS